MSRGPRRRAVVRWVGTGALAPWWAAGRAAGAIAGSSRAAGYGPLHPVLPTNSDALRVPRSDDAGRAGYDLRGVPLLALPMHFRYHAISCTGMAMSDGRRVPGRPDGMAAFAGPRPGTTRLVRNHELRHGSAIDGDAAGVVVPDALKWDPNAIGGTTTLLVDGDGGVLDDRASLGGTENNCAGGPTPWGSWLTCEETVATPESTGGRLARRHGYVFEVPAHGMTPTAARPIVGMGRFVHEAAAVDPRSGTVYLSEDRPDGALYRYRPREPGRLIAGGALEALRLRDGGGRSVDTSRGLRGQLGRRLAVDWVPVAEPDSADDSVRRQAQSLGAARFARGEGLWAAGPGGASDARITLVCTSGGDAGLGQVFAYDPADDSLTLVTESTDRDVLEHPDNVAPGPDGRLLLCEDGPGGNALVGLDEDGTPFTFARNLFNDSEFCGACSSPDGRFLFVNVQEPGLTLVIEGPWRRPPPR